MNMTIHTMFVHPEKKSILLNLHFKGGCATHSIHTCRGQNDYGKEIKQMLKVRVNIFWKIQSVAHVLRRCVTSQKG